MRNESKKEQEDPSTDKIKKKKKKDRVLETKTGRLNEGLKESW